MLGAKLTQADASAVKEMGALRPNPAFHPNLFAWTAIVTKFADTVMSKWPAGELPRPAIVEKKEAKAASTTAPVDNIDEDDLFGDDDAIEVAATLAAKKKAAEPAKPKKAAPIAKSIVLIEVKPCDDETDLDVLATRILAINKDGLVWKTEYKKEPIAYGIFKLIIGFVVEDEKVSVDNDIIPMLEEWED